MKTKTHGGKRAGAGRKNEGRVHITAKVKKQTRSKIDNERGKLSIGKFLDRKILNGEPPKGVTSGYAIEMLKPTKKYINELGKHLAKTHADDITARAWEAIEILSKSYKIKQACEP